jgi:hypothetical protein
MSVVELPCGHSAQASVAASRLDQPLIECHDCVVRGLLLLLFGAALAVLASSTSVAAAASPCDAITQRGTQINQEQLAFTKQAYSDGTITPEEEAQADVYYKEIAQTTADLQRCIETGVVPPGYQQAAAAPPAKPPQTDCTAHGRPVLCHDQAVVRAAVLKQAKAVRGVAHGFAHADPQTQSGKIQKMATLATQAKMTATQWAAAKLPRAKPAAKRYGDPGLANDWNFLKVLGNFSAKVARLGDRTYESGDRVPLEQAAQLAYKRAYSELAVSEKAVVYALAWPSGRIREINQEYVLEQMNAPGNAITQASGGG